MTRKIQQSSHIYIVVLQAKKIKINPKKDLKLSNYISWLTFGRKINKNKKQKQKQIKYTIALGPY